MASTIATVLMFFMLFTIGTGYFIFVNGLNSILLVAAFVLFAGAILAFLLIREKDFVASGPATAGPAAH